jgi:hypothetical protein
MMIGQGRQGEVYVGATKPLLAYEGRVTSRCEWLSPVVTTGREEAHSQSITHFARTGLDD